MQYQLAAFLTLFILFEYVYFEYKGKGYSYYSLSKHLRKPFSCQSCLTFWSVLLIGLAYTTPLMALIGAELCYLSYKILIRLR